MNQRLVVGLALLLLVASGAEAAAFEDELKAYQQILARVCVTGVTRELERLYQAALRAVEAAQSAGQIPRSFAGVRSPERAYLDCFQGR